MFTSFDAYSQTSQDTSSKDIEDTIHIPDTMFVGNQYYGIIHNTLNDERIALVASSDETIISTDSNIFISDVGNNLFKISANRAGIANININMDGQITSHKITVHQNSENMPYLKMIFPTNQTSVEKIQGMIYLMNGDSTVISKQDVKVDLFSDPDKIDAPRQVTILNGTTSAMFDVYVYQDGHIQAIAENMLPDIFEISLKKRNISVVIEAAPTIMHPFSSGYISVALYENGMPFVGSESIPLTINTSNPKSVSMYVGQYNDKPFEGVLVGGVGIFRTYSHLIGTSTMTVSVDGIGSKSITLFSGAADTGIHNVNYNGTASLTDEEKQGIFQSSDISPNFLFSKVIPSITANNAWLVSGMYFLEKQTIMDVTANSTINISEDTTETFYPVLVDDREIKITSDGAIHDATVQFETLNTKTHVNIFEISGNDNSEYTASITAPGIQNIGTSTFTVKSPSSSEYKIQVTPFPVVQGYVQDIAMISLHDNNGVMIDPREGFDVQRKIMVDMDEKRQGEYSFENSPVIILREDVTNFSHNLNVYESGKLHDSKTITTALQNNANTAKIFLPTVVYAFEEFPAYAHLRNSNEIPTRETVLETYGGCEETDNHLFVCNSKGSIGLNHKYGIPLQSIDPLFRELEDVPVDIPSTMSTGKTYSVKIQGDYDEIKIDGNISHKLIGDTIIFNPKSIGTFEINIILEKAGYTSKIISSIISVTDNFSIRISAYDNQGYPIPAKYKFSTIENSFTTHQTHNLERFQTGVMFEEQFADAEGNQLDLVGINVDGEKHSANTVTINPETNTTYVVNATYAKIFSLTINDKYGQGQSKEYEIGTSVSLVQLPDQPLALFFIQDIFEGYDNNANFVVMDRDVEVTAVYREDITGLLVSIVAVIFVLVFALWKNDSEKIMNIIQTIDEFFKSIKKSYKHKKSKNTTTQKNTENTGEKNLKKSIFEKLKRK